MNYQDKLRSYLGQTVEVVTGDQVITGVLLRVTDSTAAVAAAASPGYGSDQQVTFQLDRITYVRVV